MDARAPRIAFWAAFVPLCWLLMMVLHELGHVLGAWLSGGTVERVVLHPLAISRTDLAANPQPALVAWAGPLLGVLLPVLGWAAWRAAHARSAPPSRWFAGFCAVANGAYLGIGSLTGDGDAGDLLREGAAVWQLTAFGIVALAAGLWLWHGLGRSLSGGFADTSRPWLWSGITGAALLVVVIAELAVGSS